MEGFVLNALVGIVSHQAHKLPGTEIGDTAGWNSQVKLGVAGHGGILPVDGDAFTLLYNFSNAVAYQFGSIPHGLAAENIGADVHDHLRLLSGIIFLELRVILDSQ